MSTEHVSPGIFHLHLDGSYASAELDAFVKSQFGFVNGDFCGHPKGYRHFEPAYHRIFKTKSRERFNEVWDAIEERAIRHGMSDKFAFTGYMEGEFIRSDEAIMYKHGFNNLKPPFQLHRRQLRGLPSEPFREAELHLVMDKDESDPGLIASLLQAGLYGAHIPKSDHVAIVLTAQGYVQDVDRLVDAVRSYVMQAGGAVRCTLKNERAIRYAMFGIDHTDLPEIVDRVEWRT